MAHPEIPLPATMRTWKITRSGPPATALTLSPSSPVPHLSPKSSNQVLVKITYAGLNPADIHFMLNLPAWLPFRRHPTPGLDFVGTVVRKGADVPGQLGLEVGMSVCGALSVGQAFWGVGSLAEYVCVPGELVARVPGVFLEEGGKRVREAVGCGVAGQTAALVSPSFLFLFLSVRSGLVEARRPYDHSICICIHLTPTLGMGFASFVSR